MTARYYWPEDMLPQHGKLHPVSADDDDAMVIAYIMHLPLMPYSLPTVVVFDADRL